MRASIQTHENGTVTVVLDSEAARSMFASVIFAARFHEDIAPLARIVERESHIDFMLLRRQLCR
jgi:hypothetical protein